MLDLSAAFDTLDHSIHHLDHHFGVSGKVFQWFKSYLKQMCSLDSSMSQPSDILFGLPQGSVLGPTLFTPYTAPLEDICTRLGINVALRRRHTAVHGL